VGSSVALVGSFIYLGLLLIQLVMSLGNFDLKSPNIIKTFEYTSAGLSLFTCFAFVATIFSLFTGGSKMFPSGDDYTGAGLACGSILPDSGVYAFAVVLLGAPLIGAAFAIECKAVLSSYAHYVLMLPVYVNTMSIYAIANLHGISWGTKGLETEQPHGPAAPDAVKQNLDQYRREQERIKAEKEKKGWRVSSCKSGRFT